MHYTFCFGRRILLFCYTSLFKQKALNLAFFFCFFLIDDVSVHHQIIQNLVFKELVHFKTCAYDANCYHPNRFYNASIISITD